MLVYWDYSTISIFSISCFIFANILFLVSFIVSSIQSDYQKLSMYECGFEPFGRFTNNFYIKFYLLAILFIIFDLEIILLFPWAFAVHLTGYYGFFYLSLFLLILSFGLFIEWKKGILFF